VRLPCWYFPPSLQQAGLFHSPEKNDLIITRVTSLSEGEWLATDGKSIKSTVLNYSNAYQAFVSLVSIFSSKQGVVVGLQPMNNKQKSEIATVQSLIAALDIKGAIFSFDALHCQKKLLSKLLTVEMIT